MDVFFILSLKSPGGCAERTDQGYVVTITIIPIRDVKEQSAIFIKHYSRVEVQRCHPVYNGLQQLFIVVLMCDDSVCVCGGGLLTEASAREGTKLFLSLLP